MLGIEVLKFADGQMVLYGQDLTVSAHSPDMETVGYSTAQTHDRLPVQSGTIFQTARTTGTSEASNTLQPPKSLEPH
jgi:hypothetical protein